MGSLLPVLLLRRFQQAGHKPIAVVGGATGMIGDPSGKSQERNLFSAESIERNVAGLREQMRRFLDFDAGPHAAMLVNNYDWTGPFSYLEFLRNVGKNFPVNVMLAKDSVKSRLGRDDCDASAGMSYTEFSYMLLQAYDFVHLYDAFGCELQVGGSDQWGNITAGIDLAGGCAACNCTASRVRCSPRATARRWARRKPAPCGSLRHARARTSSINTGSASTTPTSGNACGC